MRIILYRTLAAIAIGLLLLGWFYPMSTATQQALILVVGFGSALLLLLQVALSLSQRVALLSQWVFQYAADSLLVSVLILATGGIFSPFSFLLGVVVIASGIHAQALLPLLISTVSCIGYLTAIYTELWLSHSDVMNTNQALHVLLQVSALLLVGGVMAFIARRHASLSASSDMAVRQHRKLKDLHDKIMSEMREGVILLNQQLHLIDMNEAARIMLKRESLASLLHFSPLAHFFQQALAHDSVSTAFQCEYDCHDQVLLLAVRRLSLESDMVWLLTVVDVSQVRQLEEQLIQQEKMAALGQMAAMLAHEIRNPIQTMAQGLEIMSKSPANALEMQHIFHEEALRLNRLVNVMLQYSKPLHAEPAFTFMPEVIKASLQHVDSSQRQHVEWQCSVDALFLDADHFRLVLDNLLSNALLNRADDSNQVLIDLAADHNHWKLRVCNPGEIPLDVREKLFEPFVSGRSAGIGLGLATVQQVCMVNGWQVEVATATGEVCFSVSGAISSHDKRNEDVSEKLFTEEKITAQQHLEVEHG